MKRILPLIAATSLAVASPELQALSLAELQVQSRLDEPLRARIPLSDLQGIDPSRLRARLANKTDFQEAGLPRAAMVDDVQLTLSHHEDGDPVLLLSTEQAVSEPYLELLLTLEWPGGEQRRRVNVLLDPPGYANPSSSPDQASTQAIALSAATGASSRPEPSESSTAIEAVAAGDESRRQRLKVRYGDALSTLADRARRGKNVTLEQAMLALLIRNPEAFSRDNINALRAGAVLDVPTREVLSAIGAGQARHRVREQNEAWQSRHQTPVAVESHDAMPLEQVTIAAESMGDAPQKSAKALASKESGVLAPSDEINRDDARSLDRAMQRQESRLGELEADRRATREAIAVMRQERARLEGEIAALREELTGVRDEFAQALQELSPPTHEAVGTGSVANAADEARGPAERLEEPSIWRRATGYLMTIGGVAAIVLLAFLLRWRRQRHTVVETKQADLAPHRGDDGEPESMSAAQMAWPASATSPTDRAQNAEAEDGATLAEFEAQPAASFEADDALAWLEKSSEDAFQDDIEHEAMPSLAPIGGDGSKSCHETGGERQGEGNGSVPDEVERIMDYEPPILEPTLSQRPQEWLSQDTYPSDVSDVASSRKDDVHFDQKPDIGEEWEVEEVTFEALQLDDKPADPETFKR